jgi:hypothetical protein
MTDARAKQRSEFEQSFEVGPWQRLPARPPVEPRVPESPDLLIELPNAAVVRRPPVVLVMAPKFGVECRGLVLNRVVSNNSIGVLTRAIERACEMCLGLLAT